MPTPTTKETLKRLKEAIDDYNVWISPDAGLLFQQPFKVKAVKEHPLKQSTLLKLDGSLRKKYHKEKGNLTYKLPEDGRTIITIQNPADYIWNAFTYTAENVVGLLTDGLAGNTLRQNLTSTRVQIESLEYMIQTYNIFISGGSGSSVVMISSPAEADGSIRTLVIATQTEGTAGAENVIMYGLISWFEPNP